MIFLYPLEFGGLYQNIAIPFGMEKLEWWGYLYVTDGRTDGRMDRQASCHGIVRAMDTRRAVKLGRDETK